MGPLKCKNETLKFVHFYGNSFCIFFFVMCPAMGRASEQKNKNETEVRGILYSSKSLV